MAEDDKDDAQLVLLGQIRGELSGIKDLIRHSNESTDRRIDDFASSVDKQTAALNRRIDDHQNSTENRFKAHDDAIAKLQAGVASNKRNTIVASGGTAGLMTGLVELVKAGFGG